LLLLAIPIALFTVTIWRLLAKSAELRLPEKQIAGSFAVGAVVGIVVTTIFWSNGRRLFAVSIGIMAWWLLMLVGVTCTGIPVLWFIE
jgi:hypothetical protein